MTPDPQAWARLGHLLKQARLAQGLKQSELAERAGVSTASVQSAEAGAVPKARMPTTLGPIATALSWPAGAIDRVLGGGNPSVAGKADEWRDASVQQQIDAEVASGIITNAMVRATSKTTSDEIKEATRLALDEFRRHGLIAETNGAQPSMDGANT
ncbi:helix-turn-helix domain-containing protein [Streptomyces sp. NPDC002908]|jgi:transcriptional regulator with XRE-family HTH domain|uniref:helix-turn-helix domain-containing protein n=1 Tax=Streptomyces sp. NPDC002908 TaxID=3364670 RepID=UPI003682C5D8